MYHYLSLKVLGSVVFVNSSILKTVKAVQDCILRIELILTLYIVETKNTFDNSQYGALRGVQVSHYLCFHAVLRDRDFTILLYDKISLHWL